MLALDWSSEFGARSAEAEVDVEDGTQAGMSLSANPGAGVTSGLTRRHGGANMNTRAHVKTILIAQRRQRARIRESTSTRARVKCRLYLTLSPSFP